MKEFKFSIDGQKYTTSVTELPNNEAEVVVNGTTYKVLIERDEPKKVVVATPAPKPVASAPAVTPVAKKAEVPAGGTKVVSPLPGSVIKVLVQEGATVKKGDTLLTLESMKMENAIEAEVDGKVSKVLVTPGQSVMQDDVLIVLE